MQKNKTFPKKTFIVLGIIVLISLLAEMLIFNFRSMESLFNKEIPELSVSFSDGTKTDGKSPVKITTEENVHFTISNINEKVNNINLNLHGNGLKVIPLVISATDEGNSSFYSFPEREIVDDIKATKYIKLNLAGKAKDIKVELKNTQNQTITVESVSLNTKVPVTFSIGRVLFVIFILSLFYFIRPRSAIYNLSPDEKQKRTAFVVFLIVNILIILLLVNINPAFKDPVWQHHKQYHSLAESLAKGQFHLDAVADERLVNLENPYDYNERVQTVGMGNFLWDHAFFEGKYYVYFGIVPCILYYLPVYLLTGSHMPTYIVIFLNAALSVLGIMLVLKEIMKKHYPHTPYAVYLLLCQTLIIGGGIWLIAKRPDFYFVPISTAIMLTLFGLYFWLTAKKDDGKKGYKLNNSRLILGSLFMALVAGARPQFILASFFIFIIFFEPFKDKKILSKNTISQTSSVVIPYVLVAAFLMYYNFARFGSPFDFGANYNLTFNDMTLRGIRGDRTFLGWFSYLLQPPNITAEFPFVQATKVYTAYQGTTITEEMFGGFLLTNPFAWFCVLSFSFRKCFEDKKQFIITLMCTVFALIITFADTQMAGILTRYVADFGLFLAFGSAISFMTLYNGQKSPDSKKILLTLLIICFAITLSYNLLLIFSGTGESIRQCNPDLHYKIKYLTAFWY